MNVIKRFIDRDGNFYEPYIREDGIYCPVCFYDGERMLAYNQLIISKEMFVEAYNKWIKGDAENEKD